MRNLLFFLFCLNCFFIKAQRDSILISAELLNERELKVNQKIIYYNRSEESLSEIKLLNWIEAYKRKNTPLAKRKLEDDSSQMYFAKENQLGKISDIEIVIDDTVLKPIVYEVENIYLPFSQSLAKGDKKEIELSYKLYLPDALFTGYGRGKEQISLKYFFLVPDTFENQKDKYFLDIEETQNVGSFWKVNFQVLEGYLVQSNLDEIAEYTFQGVLNTDVEFYLSKTKNKVFVTEVDGEKIRVELAFPIKDSNIENLEFYLPLHLKFIKEKIGWLPKKILLSPKQKIRNTFLGNEDIRVLNKRLALFSEAEKIDLDYFNLLSYNIINQSFIDNKNKDHWLKNGLTSYLEIQYLKKFYKNHYLLGDAREWTFLGMKPLKWSNISKLKLIDRYGIAYQYVMSKNQDQAIGAPYSELTNENQKAVNKFEMGTLLDFLSEKEGKEIFEQYIRSYINDNKGKLVNTQYFIRGINQNFGEAYRFIEDFINQKKRIDFSVEAVQKVSEDLHKLKVSKNTHQNIPFKLEIKDKEGNSKNFWFDTEKQKQNEYELSENTPKKLVINPNYSFLESNFRNNFSEKRWFGFNKKLKFRLFTDIPNPEYNEVYLNPDFRYNIYDELLVGLNFSNSSLVSQPFSYSVTPFLSVGEGRFTGTAGMSYRIQPIDSFFRRLTLGVSGAYFHYNYNLAYRKAYLYSQIDFAKRPRSLINKGISISYQYIDRDVSPKADLHRIYTHYGLWNFRFYLNDKHPIHEKYFTAKYQFMRDFQKLSLEGIYYWKFAPKKQIQLRFFGGLFLRNNAKNRTFNFGVSRVNDYNFAYSLLGQSAISGLFSQEFILADGGFKSYVGGSANQWITALNADVPLWKMFSLYGDIGMYKNKSFSSKFVWDTGLKISVIPSVLEVYFPIQSSLGFEPTLKRYEKRIRFSLNLDVNNLSRAVRKLTKK